MAWFEIISELLRLHVIFMVAFVPLFIFGLWGLKRKNEWAFIVFVLFSLIGCIVFDLRILITGQLFLLWGWVYWLERKPKIFIVLSALLFLLFITWWFYQKLWYSGLV